MKYTIENVEVLRTRGYSFREIARKFGKSVSTIHERLKLWKNRNLRKPYITGVSENYYSIHKWNLRKNGRATKCENLDCLNQSNRYEWALKKGKKHKRKIDNYYQLCKKCHANYDLLGIKIRTNKGRKKPTLETKYNN